MQPNTREATSSHTVRASVMVALSACGFGAIAIFTLLATRDGATLQAVLLGRYAIASVALVLVAGGPRALRLARTKTFYLLAAGGLGQVLLTYCGLSALRYLPAATVSFIFYTYPLWVTVIEAATGAERLTRVRVGALLLALAGLAIMVGSPFTGQLSLLGILLALAAAVIYAIYIPVIGKLQVGVAPAVSAAWVAMGAGIIYLLVGALTRTITAPDSLTGWSAIVAMALFSTVAAFILFLRGLATLGPVRTAIISTVEPFFTAILAALVLGQALMARTFAGGVLIVAAVTLINLSRSE